MSNEPHISGVVKDQRRVNQEDDLALDVHDIANEPESTIVNVSAVEVESGDSFSEKMVEENDAHSGGRHTAPVPPLVKFGLPAVIIIVLAGIGVVANYLLSSNNDSDVALGNDFVIGGAPIESGVHAPVTGSPALISSDEQLSSFGSDIDALRALISPLQTSNAELQEKINAMADAVVDREQQIDDLRAMLMNVTNDSITSLVLAEKQYAKKLNDLRRTVNKNKRRIDQATKRKAGSPPFSLLSIDEWGATTSAVLGIGGKTTVASVGDVRAGWKITKIVRPNCIYAVRLTGGKSVKVCGAGIL